MFKAKSNIFRVWMLVLLISIICPAMAESVTSGAEKLVTVVPDDVVGFIATSGGDELKPAFEKAILGRVWNDPGVQSFCQSIKKEVLAKIKQEVQDPNEAKIPDVVMNLVQLALKRPLIIGAAENKAGKDIPLCGFAILDTGTKKTEIAKALSELEGLVDKDEIIEIEVASIKMHWLRDSNGVPGYWGWVGNYLVFAVNDGEGLGIKHLSKPRAEAPDYLKKVQGTNDALAVYIDCQRTAGIVSAIAKQEGEEEDIKLIALVLNELGLSNIKAITSRAGFDGPDVVSNDLMAVPQPRTGLLANLKTIKLSMFDMVDAKAVNASAFNCDIAGMYDTIMRTIKVVSPNDVYPEVQKAIAEFESEAELSIRKELLASLAGPTVVYSLPMGMMEAPSGGAVVIGKLNDVSAFEKAVDALGKFAAAESEGMVQVSSQVQEGRTFHTFVIAPLAMMQVMPTWTVVDSYVVIGSNIGLCNLAVKQMTAANRTSTSIRATEGFKKVTTAKLPDNLISLGYVNSKVQFNQMMIQFQQFWPMVTMTATNAGLKLPFMLPSLTHIAEDMGPSCSYSWFDSEGLRSHYRGSGVEQTIGAAAGAAIGIGIAMPALGQARQAARQTSSASNLRQIGIACIMYADDHEGNFPAELKDKEVLKYLGDSASKVLESPRKPKDFDGPSYIYITGQSAASPPDSIIAYENPEFCVDKINVLFNDCHVEAMEPAKFKKALEETYKRLGREMPEIKFGD